MKKSLLLAGMLAVGLANAQTGKVGINTENPQETLEINGTLRVDNLPKTGVEAIYDGAEIAETTFAGTDMVVADEQGNLGKSPFPFGEILVGGDQKDAFSARYIQVPSYRRDFVPVNQSYINAGGTGTVTSNINLTSVFEDVKFTLTKRSLVFFHGVMGFGVTNPKPSNFADFLNGTYKEEDYYIDDSGDFELTDATKRLAFRLVLNGTISDSGIGADEILRSRHETGYYQGRRKLDGGTVLFNIGIPVVMNRGNVDQLMGKDENNNDVKGKGLLTGVWSLTGTAVRILEPGDYTLNAEGKFTLHPSDGSGVLVYFGNGTVDRLDVLAIPLEF